MKYPAIHPEGNMEVEDHDRLLGGIYTRDGIIGGINYMGENIVKDIPIRSCAVNVDINC
jgi:hypothetical protein